MSNIIELKNEDMVITTVPTTIAEGSRRGNDLVDSFLKHTGDDIKELMESPTDDYGATLTLTVRKGNEVQISELCLTATPEQPADDFKAVVKSQGEDGQLKETPLEVTYLTTPRVMVKGVEIETSTQSFAAALYDQLTTGLQINLNNEKD